MQRCYETSSEAYSNTAENNEAELHVSPFSVLCYTVSVQKAKVNVSSTNKKRNTNNYILHE
jgi:hypothetical protein